MGLSRVAWRERLAAWSRTALQVLAILLLAGIVVMLVHKGHADMNAIARQNAVGDFFPALIRYVFRNLAGG